MRAKFVGSDSATLLEGMNDRNRNAAKNFTDLEVWQLARSLTTRVYVLTRKGPLAKDFSLVDQLRRSAVSIPANIAEGLGRGGNREFLQFLAIARGSLRRT